MGPDVMEMFTLPLNKIPSEAALHLSKQKAVLAECFDKTGTSSVLVGPLVYPRDEATSGYTYASGAPSKLPEQGLSTVSCSISGF